MPHRRQPFRRVVLKISGESFSKPGQSGIDPEALSLIAAEIVEATATGCEMAVVVGGGNMIRGAQLAAHRRGSTSPPPTTWACSAP